MNESRRLAIRAAVNRQSSITLQGFVLFLCLMFSMLPALAGGSCERVAIDEIAITGVDYTLIVTPSDSANADPYLGRCSRFQIRGTIGRSRARRFSRSPD